MLYTCTAVYNYQGEIIPFNCQSGTEGIFHGMTEGWVFQQKQSWGLNRKINRHSSSTLSFFVCVIIVAFYQGWDVKGELIIGT